LELKLRNNLSCLENDKLYLGTKVDDEALLERLQLDTIQDDAMASIEQVKTVLDEQLERLKDQSEEKGTYFQNDMARRSKHESKRLSKRQSLLEVKMSEYLEDASLSREEVGEDGSVQQFISKRIM
jgi:hypothetical protein